MDNLLECPGGGYILPDGTSVALENVEEMHKALAPLFPDDPDTLVQSLCWCSLQIHEAGLPGLAPDYLDRAIAAGGSDEATANALLRTGAAFERMKDLQAAAETYERAMHLPEQDPFTWYYLHNNLGYCLSMLERYAEAVPHCLAAIRREPGVHNAFKNLGIALQGLGRVAEAAGCFRHACELNQEDDRARKHLADLLFGGRIEEVPNIYQRERCFLYARSRLVEITTNEGDTLNGEHVPMEDFDGMYLCLAEYFEDRTDITCMALGMLLWLYTLTEIPYDRHRAAEHITAAGSPAEAAASFVRLADNLDNIGHPAAALEFFARAEALIPRDDHFLQLRYHSRLGWCLTRLGRHREARPHFREAIRLDHWQASYHYGLGITLLAQGDTAAAEREMLTAGALSSDSPRKRLPRGVE